MLSLSVSASDLSTSPDFISKQALDLAADSEFDQALSLISAQPASIKDSYAVRFAQARILSWSGKYLEAGQAYRSLRQDYPDDPDIRVGQSYLEYFRGNLKDAETGFNQVLTRHPGYHDARKGLSAVKRAKRDNTPWKLDTGLSWSTFENSQNSDWSEQFVRIERRLGNVAASAKAHRYRRFDRTDNSFQFGLASHLSRPWDWHVSAGFTPDATFRPDYFGSANLGYSFKASERFSIRTNLDYRIDAYEAATIHTLSPDIGLYFDNGIALTSRLISVLQSGEDDLYGWLVSGSAPIGDNLDLRFGLAEAPDTINGEAVETDSIFAGLRWNFTDFTSINLDISRDDRENSFIRNSYSVWLSHNF